MFSEISYSQVRAFVAPNGGVGLRATRVQARFGAEREASGPDGDAGARGGIADATEFRTAERGFLGAGVSPRNGSVIGPVNDPAIDGAKGILPSDPASRAVAILSRRETGAASAATRASGKAEAIAAYGAGRRSGMVEEPVASYPPVASRPLTYTRSRSMVSAPVEKGAIVSVVA